MKKFHLLISICLLNTFWTYAQTPIFDDSFVHEIRITSTDTNLWNNLQNDYNMFYPDVPYTNVTVEMDGTILDEVGVRQKGFSSNFFPMTNKKPLKLNFGKFVVGQEYDGVKRLNLMNGFGDPAMIKDKMAYDMFRMHGIPSPRVAHTKLYINDTYWGIYSMIEQIDKNYLKRNFSDNDGNLWKNKGNSELTWAGTNPNSYTFELQTNETENDWSKFIEFIDVINNTNSITFKEDLEAVFDVDEYLRILAIDLLINNWDSYIEHGRNWYLYHEPNTNKIHWLPWDYNFAFDSHPNGSQDFPLFNFSGKVLIDRILNVPEFKEQYLVYMCEILAVNFENLRMDPLLDAQLGLIETDWDTATNNIYNGVDVENAINSDTWFGDFTGLSKGFKKFIADRKINMQQRLVNEGFTCTPLAAPINNQDVVINEFMASNGEGSIWEDQDNEHDDWIELYNNTDAAIDLNNYFLSDSRSFLHKWELPDVSIPANGYLIIWADKDPQQEGIHAKFDIDKDGDELFLSYLDRTIIDEIDWSEEIIENTTLARIPNGTGDFVVTDVTFNAENGVELGVDSITFDFGIVVYPNPANEYISIAFNNEIASSVIVYDMIGRQVYKTNNEENILSIDVSNWQTGMYSIALKSNNYQITKRIIIN